MLTIRELLVARGYELFDKHLAWGAKASDYRDELKNALETKRVCVLIELPWDLDEELPANATLVDHHGPAAGANVPTALEQVARLIGITEQEWASNRWWNLVAANDRGHINEMLALSPPATNDEIHAVRSADLQAQGVSNEELEHAKAIVQSNQLSRHSNGLTLVETDGNQTHLIAEVLHPAWGGPGFNNLLVIGSTKIGFYGAGDIVLRLEGLKGKNAQTWYGGALPERGFWGAYRHDLGFDPVAALAPRAS